MSINQGMMVVSFSPWVFLLLGLVVFVIVIVMVIVIVLKTKSKRSNLKKMEDYVFEDNK